MERVGTIERGRRVYADPGDEAAWAFAKAFVRDGRAHRSGEGDPRFRRTWRSEVLRHGFAGSGTVLYTNRDTGDRFRVWATANGVGFWGTDYSVTREQ